MKPFIFTTRHQDNWKLVVSFFYFFSTVAASCTDGVYRCLTTVVIDSWCRCCNVSEQLGAAALLSAASRRRWSWRAFGDQRNMNTNHRLRDRTAMVASCHCSFAWHGDFVSPVILQECWSHIIAASDLFVQVPVGVPFCALLFFWFSCCEQSWFMPNRSNTKLIGRRLFGFTLKTCRWHLIETSCLILGHFHAFQFSCAHVAACLTHCHNWCLWLL